MLSTVMVRTVYKRVILLNFKYYVTRLAAYAASEVLQEVRCNGIDAGDARDVGVDPETGG